MTGDKGRGDVISERENERRGRRWGTMKNTRGGEGDASRERRRLRRRWNNREWNGGESEGKEMNKRRRGRLPELLRRHL